MSDSHSNKTYTCSIYCYEAHSSVVCLRHYFLSNSVATSTVYAQTEVFTHFKGDKAQTTAEGKSVFAVGATISIETEPKGDWLPNKNYHVNWTLRLDYVN